MPKKRGKILSIVFIVCLVLLMGKILSKPLTSAFHFVFSPAEKYIWAKGQQTGTFFYYLFNAKAISGQNDFLIQQNLILIEKLNEFREAAAENIVLKQAFGLKEKEGFEMIFCQIISKGAQGDVLLIDKGEKNGLAIGMPLITSGSVLVGRIKTVGENFSLVDLITEKDLSFDVKIASGGEEQVETTALAKGLGNFNLGLDFADKAKTITPQSLVFTVALGGNFPKGLLVGEVEEVQNNPAQAFQTGKIKPYFPQHLDSGLFVIKNFQNEKYFSK